MSNLELSARITEIKSLTAKLSLAPAHMGDVEVRSLFDALSQLKKTVQVREPYTGKMVRSLMHADRKLVNVP
jgi:hypothetical protein